MRLSHVYAVRGFLAFVAFMEFVNALRSLLPSLFALPEERKSESFIQKKIFSGVTLTPEADVIVAQLFGFYSLLNCSVLAHAALFAHLLPLLSLGLLSLACKVAFYLLQGFHYSTIPWAAFQVPLLISVLALLGLLVLLWHGEGAARDVGDDNDDLLRAMRFSKVKRRKQL